MGQELEAGDADLLTFANLGGLVSDEGTDICVLVRLRPPLEELVETALVDVVGMPVL